MIEPLEIIQPEKIPLPKVYYVDKYDDLCE